MKRRLLALAITLAFLFVGTTMTYTPVVEAAVHAPVEHTIHTILHVPENPQHPYGTCASWTFRGSQTQWFNQNQIEERASLGFEVDSAGSFCGYVDGTGHDTCYFGCTGTWGFVDLYYCYNSNCSSNTKIEHTQANFTTDWVGVTPVYSNPNTHQVYQAITGVPCYGSGCYWYTPSAAESFSLVA